MKAAKSNIPKGTSTDSKLDHLQRRLASWRSRQPKRGPLPEWLWVGAAQAAGVEGVSRVSRALRLDYYKLKRRADAPPSEASAAAAPPGFVELSPSPTRPPRSECTIELSDPRGRKLSIRAPSEPAAWISLARAFRQEGS